MVGNRSWGIKKWGGAVDFVVMLVLYTTWVVFVGKALTG